MDARIERHHRLLSSIPRLISGVLLIAVGALASGCTLDSVLAAAGLPGTHFDAEVGPATVRGGYLDAHVEAGGFDYRFLFPNEPVCRSLLAESDLRFVWLAVLGRVTNGRQQCDAVGVMSLRAWRDRQPRPPGGPLPRAPASFDVVYRDSELFQLLGRFPLASKLGFSGTQRLIVVLPNEGACKRFDGPGTASMEYRATGPDPLTLISGDRPCVVLGLAQPVHRVVGPGPA